MLSRKLAWDDTSTSSSFLVSSSSMQETDGQGGFGWFADNICESMHKALISHVQGCKVSLSLCLPSQTSGGAIRPSVSPPWRCMSVLSSVPSSGAARAISSGE